MAYGDSAIVSVQNPVVLPNNSEPEPDIAIIEGSNDDFQNEKAKASNVQLITAMTKLALYAEAGIQLYIIVNIPKGCVE